MSVQSQVRYQLLFTCDGCGREEGRQSTWELAFAGDHKPYVPPGWAHFYGISVILINDVPRTARELDFCEDCVATKVLRDLITQIPFDENSLKGIVSSDSAQVSHSTD